MLKSVLLIIVLISFVYLLTGCAKLPSAPTIWQCAIDGSPRAFYCVNSKTKEQIKLPLEEPSMKGAQCMSLADFKSMAAWVETLKALADKKCSK